MNDMNDKQEFDRFLTARLWFAGIGNLEIPEVKRINGVQADIHAACGVSLLLAKAAQKLQRKVERREKPQGNQIAFPEFATAIVAEAQPIFSQVMETQRKLEHQLAGLPTNSQDKDYDAICDGMMRLENARLLIEEVGAWMMR